MYFDSRTRDYHVNPHSYLTPLTLPVEVGLDAAWVWALGEFGIPAISDFKEQRSSDPPIKGNGAVLDRPSKHPLYQHCF